MEKESFTYIICSREKTNTEGTYYDINFGGFGNNAKHYKIDVLNFIVNNTLLETRGFMIF